jgi:hypothetical protein
MIALFEPPHIPHKVITNDADGTLHLEDQIAALIKGN